MAVINPIADGPLDVRDVPNLRDAKGERIENDGNYQLCRCGQSKNKPFCDQSHLIVNFKSFTGYELKHDRIHRYFGEVDGQKITIAYNPAFCSHSKLCWRDANGVFDPDKRPWIQPDNAESLQYLIDKVNACPSGALGYAIDDGELQREDPEVQEIVVSEYGPYIVRHVDVSDAPVTQDEAQDFDEMTLCACGLSKNKPYCDGSHAVNNAKIVPKNDGPLMVLGDVELRAYGSDEAIDPERKSTVLCRCGLSKNKPYCDGSHIAAGFKSANDPNVKLRNSQHDFMGRTKDGHEVNIAYTPVLCGHVAECATRLNAVFAPGEKPWIRPEKGNLEAIEDVIHACPSGALRIAVDGGELHHEPTGVEAGTIEIIENGPYVVHQLAIDSDFNGVGADEKEYILCRCGHSNNKPFCDGSHHDVKWKGKIKD